jgi:hypothetical protein
MKYPQRQESLLTMSTEQWQNIVDFASATGQRIRARSINDITVNGEPVSYNALVEDLQRIEANDLAMSLRSEL